MSESFYTQPMLVDRVLERRRQRKRVVFLVGSGLVLPDSQGRGVPGTAKIIDMLRERARAMGLEHSFQTAIDEDRSSNLYQAAFSWMLSVASVDTANEIVRQAVLRARVRPEHIPPDHHAERMEELEDDIHGWVLSDAVKALGQLVVRDPVFFSPLLTTNFDPLLEVSLKRAGAYSVVVSTNSDGSLVDAGGSPIVVHLHGHWLRSDTLHTRTQLSPPDRLNANLKRIIQEASIVIVGYGGWDNGITRALREAQWDPSYDVAWAFYHSATKVRQEYSALLGMLAEGTRRGRLRLYDEIDANSFFPALLAKWEHSDLPTSQTATRLLPASIHPNGPPRREGRHGPTPGGIPMDSTDLKAVIFTHLGGLAYDANSWQKKRATFVRDYTDMFRAYLKCNLEKHLVRTVYMYIDWALKQALKQRRPIYRGGKWLVDQDLLTHERELRGILVDAEERALTELPNEPNLAARPRFIAVGADELLDLLNDLRKVDPELLKFLRGKNDKFTYDSPKFVDAVIRIARGDIPHLARDPVLRIDEDAYPNPKGIKALLESYGRVCQRAPFFLFSGRYGADDGDPDLVNDHAVRITPLLTHEYARSGTKERWRPPIEPDAESRSMAFLRGLSDLGAVQLPSGPTDARSAQVISGAGLVMSGRAVTFLPPFMNLDENTVWVDDHLKRRLHEALGDIHSTDVERVEEARFSQNRHKEKITYQTLDWARDHYLDRLLRGCILHRLIESRDGTPTKYALLVKDIVRFGVNVEWTQDDHDETIGKLRDVGSAKDRWGPAVDQMTYDAEERYHEVLGAWNQDEFGGTGLKSWAETRSGEHRKVIVQGVIKDAKEYIRLVVRWPAFVRAVQRLQFNTAGWLFDRLP